MREHLYKAKRIDNGEWVEGYYFKTPLTDESTGLKPEDGWFFLSGRNRHCISTDSGCVYEVYPETVCVYARLTDKDGKKIFEGDIIFIVTEGYIPITITCKFGKVQRQIYGNLVEITGFYFERSNDGKKAFPIIKNYLGKHDAELYEVIGNIFDSPELMKGGGS